MNYNFRVTVANDNYPLHIVWKVKSFSEYQHIAVSNNIEDDVHLSYDNINNLYYYDVTFSITNFINQSETEEHNNLSCIKNENDSGNPKLPIELYAFQEGKGEDFDWIDDLEDEQWADVPNEYNNFEQFVNTYGKKETKYATKKEADLTQPNMNFFRAGYLYRCAFEITGESNDVITKDVTLQSDPNSYTHTIQDVEFHRVSGDIFVGELNFNFLTISYGQWYEENSLIAIIDYGEPTQQYSKYFTTKAHITTYDPVNKIKADPDVSEYIEVFFDGDVWSGDTAVYNLFGDDGAQQESDNQHFDTLYPEVEQLCSNSYYNITLTKNTGYTLDPAVIFNIKPVVLRYVDGWMVYSLVTNLNSTFTTKCDSVGLIDGGCGNGGLPGVGATSGLVNASITQQS